MGKGRGPDSTAFWYFPPVFSVLHPPPPICGQSFSSFIIGAVRGCWACSLLWGAGQVPCSTQKPPEKPEAAGQAGGWASASLLMPMPFSLFCPQWSQAAPMAEGEHKPHEGESLWALEGYPVSPGDGWGGLIPFFQVCGGGGGEKGFRNGAQKGRREHHESHPSFWRTLFPTQASARNRTCCLFLLLFPVKFYLGEGALSTGQEDSVRRSQVSGRCPLSHLPPGEDGESMSHPTQLCHTCGVCVEGAVPLTVQQSGCT